MVVVVGDLLLDVVVVPDAAILPGTDAPGTVALRQGGSAATTARWLARLGAGATLIAAVGDDAVGRLLVERLAGWGVRVRVARVPSVATGRLAVIVDGEGERSFVGDRGAASRLAVRSVRAAWFDGAAAVHVPAYSLSGGPVVGAARRAIALGRARGARISVELSSTALLVDAAGARLLALLAEIAPDVLFANQAELAAMERARALAPLVVVKRGARGAAVLRGGAAPIEVPAPATVAGDTTGAGDAFDAGFLAMWLAAGAALSAPVLGRAARAGNRAAARHLREPPVDLL